MTAAVFSAESKVVGILATLSARWKTLLKFYEKIDL